MGKIDYPKEYIEKLKSSFPDWTELHEALDTGDIVVGEFFRSNIRTFRNTVWDRGGCEDAEKERSEGFRKLYEDWSNLPQVRKVDGFNKVEESVRKLAAGFHDIVQEKSGLTQVRSDNNLDK